MTTRREKEHGANRLLRLMRERDLTITRLSERSGIAPGVISRIISQNRDYKFSTAIKLAKGLHVSLDQLAGRTNISADRLEHARRLSAQLDNVLWKD